MKKSSVILFSLVFLVTLFTISIYAQETDSAGTSEIESIADEEDAQSSSSEQVSSDVDTEGVDALVEEAQTFDEELDASAGILPGSPFEFLDRFSDSREEKVAEMRELSEMCSQGDKEACDNIDVSFEQYKEQASVFEREVTPEERDEAEETSRAIRGVMVREIAQNVDPTKKDEFIRGVVQQENDIELAANIAAQIEDLCGKLVELGETQKAYKVCNLENEQEDAPEWLREKRNQWKGEISDNAKKFLDVLQGCMQSSDDNILGNVKEKCACDQMPEKNADLCVQISTLEDACNAGQEDSCGKSDAYIEEFMSALPDELRVVMEQQMGELDGEKQGGSSESFEREFRKRAPPQCIAALESGKIDLSKGMFTAKKQCEEIMMGEFGDSKCREEGLSPDECADIMSSSYEKGPPQRGPGIDFVDCEGFDSNEQKLECYRHNKEGAEFTGDYYSQKKEFGQRGGDFGEFDSKFRQEHVENYVDFESRREKYQSYYNNPADNKKRMEDTFKPEEACVRTCASDGKAWNFVNGKCECFGGEERRDYQDYEQFSPERGPPPGWQPPVSGYPSEGQQQPPFTGEQPSSSIEQPPQQPTSSETSVPSGGEGSSSETSTSSSSGSSGEGSSSETSSSSSSSAGEGSTTITGGVIWGRITGNAFLDYHWYG